MSAEKASELKELPQSMRVLVVDDEQSSCDKNMAALQEALSPHVKDLSVSSADNAFILLDMALTQMPDMVVLDHDYTENLSNWKLNEMQIEDLAQKFGIKFDSIKKPDRDGWTVHGEMPDDLYFPSATSFALLLRYFGYEGKIVIASSGPPEPVNIERQILSLNNHLQKQGANPVAEKLIEGVILKGFGKDRQMWATQANSRGNWHFSSEEMSYAQALNQLIRQI